MVKKVISSLVVFCLVVGGISVLQAGEGKTEQKTEDRSQRTEVRGQKSEVKGNVKTQGSKPKGQQVGTPTVQQLLDKVKSNYSKIKDLKVSMKTKIRSEKFAKWMGVLGNLYILQEKLYFKAPDKIKMVPPDKELTIIMKGLTEYRRAGELGELITMKTPVQEFKLYWSFLLEPWNFMLYWRLDEIITKFDTKVISNPQTNIWVIEAVPKTSNPDDDYNYPYSDGRLEIFVNYVKGVITKIDVHGITRGLLSSRIELQNFTLINNIWIPTKLNGSQFNKDGTISANEEYILTNIQINTGISDSEFEF